MDATVKAELLDELIVECEGKLQSLQAEVALEDRYLRNLRAKRMSLTDGENAGKLGSSSNTLISSSQTLPEAIKAVLMSKGKAMRARDIAATLTSNGYGKETKNGLLPSVLSALGRREDLFRKVKRGIYRLKTEQTEA